MVWRWLRLSLVSCLFLPMLALAQDPVVTREPGTADTTPPDPTIIDVFVTNLDVLSDDPGAGVDRSGEASAPVEFAYEIPEPVAVPYIDRVHLGVWNTVWRSAMHMDGWFGGGNDEAIYQHTSGSIAPALLWDKFDGLTPRLRFDVDVPLPHLNSRLHAFVGRVNRDEYVTERSPASGAFAKQYGPLEEDETLFGIRYREPRQGGNWEADAGIRFRSPLDPFVKGSYRFLRGASETTLYNFRETVFWQNSEKFGFTSRIDIERIFRDAWLVRWTGSGTISQKTEGVKGYTGLSIFRGLPNRRAIAAEIFTTGEFDAPVPTGNYGVKVAYRRSVARDWLVMETRVSCTFPREELSQDRFANWGVGIGFEMFFGTGEFLARPVTF
jgi:hypothetical protein